MELHLQGKNALVTGASYGLGFACAKALAQEGVSVTISSRDEERLNTAASELSAISTAAVITRAADLTSESELPLLIESAQTNGPIDILVVSTGHPPTYPFSVATDEQWQRGIDLILRPAIVLSRLVLKSMIERKYGRIIFIGSIFGLEPEKSSVVQSTLRCGLNALAKCMATENAPHGITVNVICPGYFDTPLVRELAKQYADSNQTSVEAVLQEWANYAPVQRFGKPEDLGALVAFLASPRGEFITGTTITIDGGAVRQY